jgi:hypothetical protein
MFGLMMQAFLVSDISYMASNSRNQALDTLRVSISPPASIPENKPKFPMELQYTGMLSLLALPHYLL